MSSHPHPDLGRLVALLGDWEGEGQGRWGGDTFFYTERLHFGHNGKPVLAYAQRTESKDDGRPLHSESGFWRPAADGTVELVLAHGTGVAEIEVGHWDGDHLRFHTVSLQTSPTAKPVTALERDFELFADGRIGYTLRMSTDDSAPHWHLEAGLRRVSS